MSGMIRYELLVPNISNCSLIARDIQVAIVLGGDT
jgi:hypothetical protein